MPTTQDGKKTGGAARAEAAVDENYMSQDVFVNPALKELTGTETVEDAAGIERIVGTGTTPFTAAPNEATPEQIEHMEKLQTTLDKAKEERLAALKGGDVPEEKRAKNVPGDAGSQSVPSS